MVQKLHKPQGRVVYRRRKASIEASFGVFKQLWRQRYLGMRGLTKVAVEVNLAATAFNLNRMWRTAVLQGRGSTENLWAKDRGKAESDPPSAPRAREVTLEHLSRGLINYLGCHDLSCHTDW
jgi:hypothetical protein